MSTSGLTLSLPLGPGEMDPRQVVRQMDFGERSPGSIEPRAGQLCPSRQNKGGRRKR